MKIDLISYMFPPDAPGGVPGFYSLFATYLYRTGHKDKVHGSPIRLIDCCGVCLDKPPFGVKISEVLTESEVQKYQINPGKRLVAFLMKYKNIHAEFNFTR